MHPMPGSFGTPPVDPTPDIKRWHRFPRPMPFVIVAILLVGFLVWVAFLR